MKGWQRDIPKSLSLLFEKTPPGHIQRNIFAMLVHLTLAGRQSWPASYWHTPRATMMSLTAFCQMLDVTAAT